MTLKKREFTPESGSVDTYGRHTVRAGDKVEGIQGQEHRRWLQNILPWRRWEEKWNMSYTEGRIHRESVRGEESVG